MPDNAAPARPPMLPLDHWAQRAWALTWYRVDLRVRVRTAGTLGSPLNTVIRGMFGAECRTAACQLGCRLQCEQPIGCLYGVVFDPPAGIVEGAHGSDGTRPYWLDGLVPARTLDAGETFVASLWLVGPAVEHGATLGDLFARAVERVRSGALDELLVVEARSDVVGAGPAPDAGRSDGRVRVTLETPLLAAVSARDKDDCPHAPWLPTLLRASVRRLGALLGAYTHVPHARVIWPDLHEVGVSESTMHLWQDDRWSARQGQRVPLRGILGAATLEGSVVGALSPLLAAAGLCGAGKQATMGFGRLSLEVSRGATTPPSSNGAPS